MEVDTSSGFNEQLAAAARALEAGTSTQRTLERCVSLATELIDGCDYAGISFVRRKAPIETRPQLTLWMLRGDELQYSLQEGPCLDAIWDEETVHSPNLATEQRWPRWAPQVMDELGVASMLSFQLYTSQDTLGALNMYSKRVDAFDDDDFNAGMLLAAQGAVALAESGHRAMAERRAEPDHHRPGGGDLDGTLHLDRRPGILGAPTRLATKQHQALPGGRAIGADT